eukprot:40845-Chlamydomonas_euryale.AAC.5
MDEHINERINKHMDEHINEHTDEHMHKHINEHLNKHMDEHINEHMGEHMDEHINEHVSQKERVPCRGVAKPDTVQRKGQNASSPCRSRLSLQAVLKGGIPL